MALPVSVVEETIVKGVAGVRGTELNAGLAGHRVESTVLAVETVDAVEVEQTEMSLKAGEPRSL